MVIGDVKQVLNVVGKYAMIVINCAIGALALTVLLIMKLFARWNSNDMAATDANYYVIVGTFIFMTLLYGGTYVQFV
jgi:hypothetical protein